MATCYLRIEAVNFNETVFDTNDLSATRGASFACLIAPRLLIKAIAGRQQWPCEMIYSGASQAAAKIDCDGDLADAENNVSRSLQAFLAGQSEPADQENAIDGLSQQDREAWTQLASLLPELTFSFAMAEASGDYYVDRCKLEASLRQRQLQQPSVPPVTRRPGSWAVCSLDGFRPTSASAEETAGQGRPLSNSVARRRRIGREMRRTFYSRYAAVDDISEFAQSFEDLTRDPPSPDELPVALKGKLPVALKGKMSLIYFDGNRFNAHRHRLLTGPGAASAPVEAERKFSEAVAHARNRLLGSVLAMLKEPGRANWCPDEKGGPGRLRFETLLWGGDEALFVVPAWSAFRIAGQLLKDFSEPRNWDVEGHALTHAMGLLICSYKTPIRLAQGLAKELAEEVKTPGRDDAPPSRLNYLILESVEIPSEGLAAFRKSHYGVGNPGTASVTEYSQFAELMAGMAKVTAYDGVPLSQVYKAIRDFRDHKGNVDTALEGQFKSWKEAGYSAEGVSFLEKAPATFSWPNRLVTLMRATELWDYFDPPGLESGAVHEGTAAA